MQKRGSHILNYYTIHFLFEINLQNSMSEKRQYKIKRIV